MCVCVPASHFWSLTFSPVSVPCPFPSSLAGPVSTPLPSHAFPGLPRFFGAERRATQALQTPPQIFTSEWHRKKIVSGELHAVKEGECEKKGGQSAGLSSAGLLHPPISGLPGVCLAIFTGY